MTLTQVGVAFDVFLAVGVSAHIILTKSDVRAAIGWTGLVWLAPVLGSLIYLFFGINRIRRRAGRLRPGRGATAPAPRDQCDPARLRASVADVPAGLLPLATLVSNVTGGPLTHGNSVEPLVNGDEAFPAMIAAIDSAERSVVLVTYIFDRGTVADRFIDALARAAARGVEVRVLIDGVGARYSHPPVTNALRSRGVRVATFLPSFLPIRHSFFNLRNHRKLLVVDGATGFCGGLNIRDGCLLALGRRDATQDLHFRMRGPVVRQLMSAAAFDWHFTTGEALDGEHWSGGESATSIGDASARGIADGPDEDFEALLLTLLGALATASSSVRIVTPYFLPDAPLLDALEVAALRGVRIEIVLPSRGNLRLVQWAQTAQLPQVLHQGVRVFLTKPPFDHSKLLVVDGHWCLFGSGNWDPRSLRLNFEYVVESYSPALVTALDRIIDAKMRDARELSRAELDRRHLTTKLRDGLVWLAQPYL